MSIVPCFDPTTGASGGPASGGGSTPTGGFAALDLSSGFTSLAPDAMSFKSTATDGAGVSTFTFDALAVGDAKYAFSGTGASWPRLYKDLTDSTGTLTTADSFLMLVRLTSFSHSTADIRFGVGLCLAPTATATADFDGYGIGYRFSSTSSNRKGFQLQLVTSSGNTSGYSAQNTDATYGVLARTERRLGGAIVFGEQSDTAPSTGQYNTSSNQQLAATTDFKLFVAAATSLTSGTISEDDAFSVKIETQIVRLR